MRSTVEWSARRVAAVIAVACVGLHVALVALGGGTPLRMSLTMLALSLVCAGCAPRLWREGPRLPESATVIASATGMVLVHLLVAHQGPADGGTLHGPAPSGRADAAHLVMHAGVTLATVEVGLVLLAVALAPSRARTLTRARPPSRNAVV